MTRLGTQGHSPYLSSQRSGADPTPPCQITLDLLGLGYVLSAMPTKAHELSSFKQYPTADRANVHHHLPFRSLTAPSDVTVATTPKTRMPHTEISSTYQKFMTSGQPEQG